MWTTDVAGGACRRRRATARRRRSRRSVDAADAPAPAWSARRRRRPAASAGDGDDRAAGEPTTPTRRVGGSVAGASVPALRLRPEPPEGAVPDRVLDVAATRARRSPNVAATWNGARTRLGAVRRPRRRQDDDREVPEVDAVGALADPAHRPAADDRAEPRGRMGDRGDHEHGREREQQEAAAVEERRELVGLPEHERDDDQSERRRRVDGPRALGRDPRAQRGSARPSPARRRSAAPSARVSVP